MCNALDPVAILIFLNQYVQSGRGTLVSIGYGTSYRVASVARVRSVWCLGIYCAPMNTIQSPHTLRPHTYVTYVN